jgi:hypothetical protein
MESRFSCPVEGKERSERAKGKGFELPKNQRSIPGRNKRLLR